MGDTSAPPQTEKKSKTKKTDPGAIERSRRRRRHKKRRSNTTESMPGKETESRYVNMFVVFPLSE
jgi:hypothetical protein